MTTTVLAPAKINLDLRVLGRRADGFHEIRTVLQSIALCDTLHLRRRPGPLTIRSRSPLVPNDQDNVVWRAASALWSAGGRAGVPEGVAITIHKRVPVAAGLGGGSSDAASAIRGLARLWGIPTRGRRLHTIASRVGSDVPYFLYGGTALGSGRGERLRRLADVGAWWVVLVQPPFGVSTADAYRWADSAPRRPRASSRLPAGWRNRLARLNNDLEAVVTVRHPEIEHAVRRLADQGAAQAAMTGSGSVVFGLYRRRTVAEAARLSMRRAGWRTWLSRTITRAEFESMTAVGAGPALARLRAIG